MPTIKLTNGVIISKDSIEPFEVGIGGIDKDNLIASSSAQGSMSRTMTQDGWIMVRTMSYNDSDQAPYVDGLLVCSFVRKQFNGEGSWTTPIPLKKGQTVSLSSHNTGYRIYGSKI